MHQRLFSFIKMVQRHLIHSLGKNYYLIRWSKHVIKLSKPTNFVLQILYLCIWSFWRWLSGAFLVAMFYSWWCRTNRYKTGSIVVKRHAILLPTLRSLHKVVKLALMRIRHFWCLKNRNLKSMTFYVHIWNSISFLSFCELFILYQFKSKFVSID